MLPGWVEKIDQFVMFQAMLPIRSLVEGTDVWKLSGFTHSGIALNLEIGTWKEKSKKINLKLTRKKCFKKPYEDL